MLGQVSQFGPTLYNFRSRLHQVVLSVAALRLLRASCFVATTLPNVDMECRLRYTGLQGLHGGGCGDYRDKSDCHFSKAAT